MKDVFSLKSSYFDKFQSLTDEQFGSLVRLLFAYQSSREYPDIKDPVVNLAFDVIKPDIDAIIEKNERISERNRLNGSKGGRPRKNATTLPSSDKPDNPKKPTGFSELSDNSEDPDADGFVPPTLDQVKEYVKTHNLIVDPERFYYTYAGAGWVQNNGNPIKDWVALLLRWDNEDRNKKYTKFGTAEKSKDSRSDKYDELEKFYLNED